MRELGETLRHPEDLTMEEEGVMRGWCWSHAGSDARGRLPHHLREADELEEAKLEKEESSFSLMEKEELKRDRAHGVVRWWRWRW